MIVDLMVYLREEECGHSSEWPTVMVVCANYSCDCHRAQMKKWGPQYEASDKMRASIIVMMKCTEPFIVMVPVTVIFVLTLCGHDIHRLHYCKGLCSSDCCVYGLWARSRQGHVRVKAHIIVIVVSMLWMPSF